ncbi:glycosyltransferase family 4 protein [Synechococcus elongatus IITB4]|uniref:glycosyltransferase family 4 protein n=1 Tax=Synechococcus elongatus TaxID=32046 RepID=UPI0030D38814
MTDLTKKRVYTVVQSGARMHYAVPALLAQAGALAAFYTDCHASHRPLQWLKTLLPTTYQPKPLKRLLGRQLPPELPRQLVRDQPLASLTWARRGDRSDALVLQRACQEQFGGANALYTNFINNDLATVQQARNLGLHIVHELITPPIIGRIALEERQRFPKIEITHETSDEVEQGIQKDIKKWELSDQVLVPSQFCLDTAVFLGCHIEKIRVVPYGLSEEWFHLQAEPKLGRILCVGRPSLLKGTHILAEACRLLQQKSLSFECRVAGPPQVDINHSLFEGPTYIGQVPRSQVREEFRQADVFVLPTLADSFGLVHLEAMACGVPVITTPHCGSVVRDGIDGFIVPIRDATALADRLEQLLSDRSLRDRMGAAARDRAREFTWARYGDRLLAALQVERYS